MKKSVSLVLFAVLLAAVQFAPGALAQDNQYLLNAGDVLLVSVWKEEELTREVLVRPDGGITFPLAGEIRAAGRAVGEVQSAIVTRLEQYVPDAVVTVAVLSVNGNKLYVLGKVARPGEYVITKELDVMQALALAGGLTSFAAEDDVKILRRGPTGTQQAISFRYDSVKQGRRLESNILLQSGDIIVVP